MTARLLLLSALLACSAAAHAEKADREKDIVVGADTSTADDANRTLVFDGNVIVTQGTMRMTANKVTVREDPQRHKFYVAVGNPVTFRQKRDNVDEWIEGYAQRAEFDDLNDVVKLYDKAKVKSNQNEITGDFISYDMGRELAQVSGAPPGKAAPPNSRVKMVIVPAKKPVDAKDAAKAAPRPAEGIQLKPDTNPQ
jgi:lipopolysaccharide export system protein LptA